MQGISSKETIAWLKETYVPGTRIRLLHMEDYQAVPSGTEGIVTGVDDIGTIHMHWDTGNSLGLVYGEDDFKKI